MLAHRSLRCIHQLSCGFGSRCQTLRIWKVYVMYMHIRWSCGEAEKHNDYFIALAFTVLHQTILCSGRYVRRRSEVYRLAATYCRNVAQGPKIRFVCVGIRETGGIDSRSYCVIARRLDPAVSVDVVAS